ncbi:MAG: hypothetical protein VST70_09485 [Nitrospirota bacterium]|nr:hypothetical protein [Nitrospirota bacterium]
MTALGNPFALSHPETTELVFRFVGEPGFDVIHFKHLEGLPAEVLTVKKHFPRIKVLFSVPDYYVLCPQVDFLFWDRELCTDGQSGTRCLDCFPSRSDEGALPGRSARRMREMMGLNPGGTLATLLLNATRADLSLFERKAARAPASPPFGVFRDRSRFVDLINDNVDRVLPVLERVGEIAVLHSIPSSQFTTVRIGKPEASRFFEAPAASGLLCDKEGSLTLAYRGYRTCHKRFYFLLDVFERLPGHVSGKITLVVAARSPKDLSPLKRLMSFWGRLRGLAHYDRYPRDQLDGILKQVSVRASLSPLGINGSPDRLGNVLSPDSDPDGRHGGSSGTVGMPEDGVRTRKYSVFYRSDRNDPGETNHS